jgi:hypothetical protein
MNFGRSYRSRRSFSRLVHAETKEIEADEIEIPIATHATASLIDVPSL